MHPAAGPLVDGGGARGCLLLSLVPTHLLQLRQPRVSPLCHGEPSTPWTRARSTFALAPPRTSFAKPSSQAPASSPAYSLADTAIIFHDICTNLGHVDASTTCTCACLCRCSRRRRGRPRYHSRACSHRRSTWMRGSEPRRAPPHLCFRSARCCFHFPAASNSSAASLPVSRD